MLTSPDKVSTSPTNATSASGKPSKPRLQRAVFIDRDGVICRNLRNHVRSWEQFAFLPGALEALARLSRLDLYVVVITNQAIINRRLASATVVEDIHARMVRAIEAAGGRVDRVFYCPHRPDERCSCRKPEPGLLLQAAEELGLDLLQSYLIGDAETDILAGWAVGCETYLVLTGRGRSQRAQCLREERGVTVAIDLGLAVDDILRLEAEPAQRVGGRGSTGGR